MLYKNIQTGVVIDSSSVIKGDYWIPCDEDSIKVATQEERINQLLAEVERLKKQLEVAEQALGLPNKEEKKIVETKVADAPKEADEEVVDLSVMSVASLKKFAAQNEIDLGKATRRDDIIQAIADSGKFEEE